MLQPDSQPEAFTAVLKPFDALSAAELYAIMHLRSEVFVVEQNCVYLDADGRDPFCHHVIIIKDEQLAAYARVLPPGLMFDDVSIGRVCSSPAMRRTGAGKLLVQKSIDACRSLFGHVPVRIAAQLYLQKFYESFGFVRMSDVYLEDNIEHIDMTLD